MDKKLVGWSLLSALGEAIYVTLVALLMSNGEKIFGQVPGPLGMAAFLLLFVISAVVSATIVLGKPIMLYLSGKKAEAVKLFLSTLGWMLVILVIALVLIGR